MVPETTSPAASMDTLTTTHKRGIAKNIFGKTQTTKTRPRKTLDLWPSVVMIIVALIFLFPFYLLIRAALSTQQEIVSTQWHWFPAHPQWKNFTDLFTDPAVPVLHSLINSVIVSVVQTIGVLIVSALAGYGFARYRHHVLTKVLWALSLASLLFPTAVTFVPSFLIVSSLGWISTLQGLIVPGLFQTFAVVMFRQFFLGFPVEVEEAARLDGLGPGRTLWLVVLPNALPIAASVGTLVFLGSWNGFLWPFIVAGDPQSWTIQLSLSTFLNSQAANLSELFAGACLSVIPSALVFILLSKYMIKGVETSALK